MTGNNRDNESRSHDSKKLLDSEDDELTEFRFIVHFVDEFHFLFLL